MAKEIVSDEIGAEIYHKWLNHLGANNRLLPFVHEQGETYLVDLKSHIGWPLTHMLWRTLTVNQGMRRIAVFLKDPKKTKHDYDQLPHAEDCCVVLMDDRGYVRDIMQHRWYRQEHLPK